jgi:glycosyltransferase involved in cell wall biosynthesis
LRVVLAHNQYAITGGADVFYHDVGRLLAANGEQVAFFSCADEESVGSEWGSYFPRPARYDQGNLIARIVHFPQMIYSRQAKRNFDALLRDFQPDLVHAFAIYTKLTPSILDAAADRGVPVVMTCNDYKLICPNYSLYHHGKICEDCKGGHFYHAVRNRCGHNSLIFSTGMAGESYAHELSGVYRKRVDTFLFESEFIARKHEEFWGAGTFRWHLMLKPFNSGTYAASTEVGDYCLYIGRLHDSKGVHVLLEALRNRLGVRLLVIGDGPERANLERMREQLNLQRVEFLGWQSRSQVGEYLERCRFVVVPSVWLENFPYVITEAFSRGKPVIGSNRGGIPELINHGEFGFVFNDDRPEELGEYIDRLWADAGLSIRMGTAAKQWCDRRFTDQACYEGLRHVYADVIARKKTVCSVAAL